MVYVLPAVLRRQTGQTSVMYPAQQNNKGSELHGSVRFLGRVPGGPLLRLCFMLSSCSAHRQIC